MTIELGATLFRVAFWIYLAAAVCYAMYFLYRQRMPGRLGFALLAAGLVVHTASLAMRTILLGRPPLLNLYEYMLALTWGAGLLYVILELVTKTKAFGSFAVPLVAMFTFLGTLLDYKPITVLPALKSVWRVPHIGSAILAYAAFAIAFGLAIMYLIRERVGDNEESFWGSRLPSLKVLDLTIYRTIAFGFLMQTSLVIVGAVWAQYAWGRYWGWDPKEVWSLITWLIYAAYLHTRTTMVWKGHRSAVMAVVGFVATMFTLFGVSYLRVFSGLHGYA